MSVLLVRPVSGGDPQSQMPKTHANKIRHMNLLPIKMNRQNHQIMKESWVGTHNGL